MSRFVTDHTTAVATCNAIDNEVSRSSILWALLPIAFNSMTQPVGRIASNISAERSLFLRASPFLCILEASAVFCQFTYFTIRTRRPRAALNRISRAKLHLSPDGGPTQLLELQNNAVFRAILFLLGVLPQAVKLYAYEGIAVSQTWASLYLGSWLVLELLVVMPARYGAVEEPEPLNSERASFAIDSLVELICCIAIHYCDFMALHYMYVRFEKERQISNQPTSWKDQMTGFGMMTGYIIFSIVRIWGGGPALLESSIFSVNTFFLFDFSRSELFWIFALRFGRFAAMIGIYGWYTERQPVLLSMKGYTQFGSVAFWLMHSLTALGSYKFMYDPAGTGKPAWTEYLD
ncbi:MAG: hypothetical protein LQ339_006707 [Xanthoria mediterranea]|nr:MAG: hypothetical protein LQ339_006707 [Xanthoria mediterranea]